VPVWYAADLDLYRRDSSFELFSAGEKFISLQVETWKHLLIIAESSLEAAPATIALTGSDFTMLKSFLARGKRGLLKKNSLLIEHEDNLCKLDWRRGVPKFFSPVHFFKADRLLISKSLKQYRDFLAEKELSSPAAVLLGLQGGEDYFRQQIGQSYPLVVESLLNQNKEAFIICCRRMAGLGRGLTPTGDDMLHGALVAFHHFISGTAFIEAVKNEFTAVTQRTNIFGRHTLEMGLRGLTPEIFGMFLRTIARGEADSRLLKRIISLGSSSGMDIAIAMFFFLKTWLLESSFD
jgi:hypothetical protein